MVRYNAETRSARNSGASLTVTLLDVPLNSCIIYVMASGLQSRAVLRWSDGSISTTEWIPVDEKVIDKTIDALCSIVNFTLDEHCLITWERQNLGAEGVPSEHQSDTRCSSGAAFAAASTP